MMNLPQGEHTLFICLVKHSYAMLVLLNLKIYI